MQSLYERKLATYPRTDSQYITHDDLETLVRLTQRDDRATGFITPDTRPDQPRLGLTVNDKKVAGHTAILPTLRVNQTCLADLNEQERLVLTRIVRRMWEAVSDDQIVEITTVQARISPECGTTATGITDEDLETGFTTRQEQALQDGWKAIEPSCQQAEDTSDDEPDNVSRHDTFPPNLVEDVTLTPVCPAELHKGETKPPARFTDATLLNAMEHASRWLDLKTKNADELKAALEDDSTHASGIGTPATQAEIIERLASSGYITRQGKSIVSTPEGRGLIDVVSPKLKDVALTANLERQLSQVEHEQTDPARVDNEFRHYAAGIPAEAKDNKTDLASVPHKQDWGPCPDVVNLCGKPGPCGNAPATSTRRTCKAIGSSPEDAGGSSSAPSQASTSPTAPCAYSWTAAPSTSGDSPARRDVSSTPCSSLTKRRAHDSISMTTKTGRTIMDVCVLLDGIMLTYTGLASIPKARSQLAIGVGFAMIITGTTCLFVSVLTLMADGVAATTHWWQAIATAAIAWLLSRYTSRSQTHSARAQPVLETFQAKLTIHWKAFSKSPAQYGGKRFPLARR